MIASMSLPVICSAAQLTVPNSQASGKLPKVSLSSFSETASVVASSLNVNKILVLKVNDEYFKCNPDSISTTSSVNFTHEP